MVDLLTQSCNLDIACDREVVVYDQCTARVDSLPADCFLVVLLQRLVSAFDSVALLQGQLYYFSPKKSPSLAFINLYQQ